MITPNPQLIVGKVLQKDEAVIEVANPRKLQAVIEIRPEDVDLVRKGAVVKLKLKGSALPAIEAKVGEFLPTYSSMEQPNRRVLRVVSGTIDLNNLILETGSPEHREALRDRLKPDAQLDATIHLKDGDRLNFLQICYREVEKFLKSIGLR